MRLPRLDLTGGGIDSLAISLSRRAELPLSGV